MMPPAKFSIPSRYVPQKDEKLLFGIILPGTIHAKISMYGQHHHWGAPQDIIINAKNMRFHHNVVDDGKVWIRHHYPTVMVEIFSSHLDSADIWYSPNPVNLIERRLWVTSKPINQKLLAYGLPLTGYLTHVYTTTKKRAD